MQRMHVARRGAISGMVLAEQPAFDEPLAPYEVEVQMQAVGLNFRDVLLVLGEYPGPPEPTGSDCAGIVAAAGELAAHARDDELFGIAAGCLEHFVRARTHMQLMVRRPASITAAEACTLPTTWNTVHEVLRRSVLRSQQTFLLHAAAGGIGLVSIEYLSWLGASAVATVGQVGKHRLVHDLGITARCSSRDAAAFGMGMSRLLAGGRAHGACNSLIDDFIPATVAGLREDGSLQELGKRAAWSAPRMVSSSVARLSTVDLATDV